ncbi:prepilin-type N-terminal cleavage/methylation domain-containing protein [Nitratiruptor tergarcus]|uniref:Tfp pilus assembly protein FimT n=1 Tax=Nitratiruptor tergarcus DSM 16512 TaxID=1069081 RepID=A0A1W1WV90_9BACT|nr:prepilin-type N-terminal cleavage/methylation domain-containing protein [Nitratiruptor tergarcus]SMC10102.1 Tfp pilus assembly protein FimT [Nitratiruptor tergarcus DSM 16512]
MKRSFSLLELIFAIVVISIVMMAIPGIFTQTTSSIEEIIKKEAVFYAYFQNGNILTYRWDENSKIQDYNTSYTVALNTKGGDNELKATKVNNPNYRIGAVSRQIDLSRFASDTLGLESGESFADDIDDFNNKVITVKKEQDDFIVDMNIKTKISYLQDSSDYTQTNLSFSHLSPSLDTSSLSTNLKLIETNVTDPHNKTILIMRAFACNNGQPILQHRIFQ